MTRYPASTLTLYALCLLTCGLGCDEDNRAPSLLPLQELTWQTNTAHSIELTATDPDGDPLTFSFELSPPPPTETEGLTGAPSLVSLGAQRALFQWTPGVGDTGQYSLTVRVRDPSGAQAEESAALIVTSAGIAGGVGGAQLSFEEPAGAGISVERSPTGGSCLNALRVRVRAEAIPDDEIRVELKPPTPEGVALSPPSAVPGKEKSLTWCPTEEQLSAQERFTFKLYAYRVGAEGAGVTKQFLVRFSRPNREDCPGEPPVIEHQVRQEVRGLADYPVDVHILDDFGVKSPPLLAYLVSPREDPRVAPSEGWTLTEFEGVDPPPGEPDVGTYWRATIPNLNLNEGQEAPIFYKVIATDNDDASGAACDQTTESPIYLMNAIGGAEGGAQGLCSPCSHDGQCGGLNDLCLSYSEGLFCGQACSPDAGQCPGGSACYELVTTEGQPVFQCVPLTGACVSQCSPDAYDAGGEDAPVPQLSPGRYPELAICREEADYYWVPIPEAGGLNVEVLFSDPQLDLDLAVALDFDAEGAPIYDYQSAQATGSVERVELPCAGGAQQALVAVYPYGVAEGPYTLNIETPTGACGQLCLDDDYESDVPALIPAEIISGLKLCPQDSDWFEFEVARDQVISVLVDFIASRGQLNVRLYNPSRQLLIERLDGRNGAVIEHRAQVDGRYVLEISGATPLVSNDYSLDVWLFEADACSDTRDCDSSTFCDAELGCLDDRCDSSLSCGALHSCVIDTLSGLTEGHCRAQCYNQDSCRMGEACKPMVNYETLCIPEGLAQLGEQCTAHEDCVGSLVCVPNVYGVGLCVDVACDDSLPCPETERCVPQEGRSVCAPSCEQSSCPGELRCERIDDSSLCVP